MAEESIADFVYKHAHEPKEEVVRRVLENPRVAAWVRDNPERRRRIEEEVERAWQSRPGATTTALSVPVQAPPQATPAPKPTAPTPSAPPAQRAEKPARAPAARPTATPAGQQGKREAFMCLRCFSAQIYSAWEGDRIVVRCRACGHEYADMLKLIPLREVGPFEFLLGTGRDRAMRVALILLAWVGLLGLLVFLR